MKAYVTSIGEPTTELCKWSLERQGIDVEVVKGSDSFNAKLEYIYHEADSDFLRVDADVIVNRNVSQLIEQCPEDIWWWQSMSFDWWRQDIGYAGVQYIKKQCLPILRKHISEVQHLDRPESLMYRLEEFHNPRRCESSTIVCGLHGWGQNDLDRVKAIKEKRHQMANYDFELARRLNEFQTT
jgi:hypothetical protein